MCSGQAGTGKAGVKNLSSGASTSMGSFALCSTLLRSGCPWPMLPEVYSTAVHGPCVLADMEATATVREPACAAVQKSGGVAQKKQRRNARTASS